MNVPSASSVPPCSNRPRYPTSSGRQSSYRTPDFYLIAFTDKIIQTALTYYVDGDTLHWTTREHEERQAPLATVDRDFSYQLNRDRKVEFRLP